MTHQYRGYDYDVNVCDANGDVDVFQTLVQYHTKMLELEQLYIRFLPNHFHPDGRPEIKVCCKGNWLHRFRKWASLFRLLTILELAIFGAKIQTNVNQKKIGKKRKEKEIANNNFIEEKAKFKGHLFSI